MYKQPQSGKQQRHQLYDSSSNISNSNGDICRICHCEGDSENPLLSPCYCSGSLKYVHQSCLRQWLAASDTRSCELCKFNFILQTKIKPLSEWRRLEMSSVERRRLLCAILFHFVAAICVIWSLFVLIDRAAEEVSKGLIAWPFWTKLVVVAVGFTGGAVFMYIQCRQYLHLFSRWKAHNRIILVQNAPEKPPITPPPSPSYIYSPPIINNESPVHCYVFEHSSTKMCDMSGDILGGCGGITEGIVISGGGGANANTMVVGGVIDGGVAYATHRIGDEVLSDGSNEVEVSINSGGGDIAHKTENAHVTNERMERTSSTNRSIGADMNTSSENLLV